MNEKQLRISAAPLCTKCAQNKLTTIRRKMYISRKVRKKNHFLKKKQPRNFFLIRSFFAEKTVNSIIFPKKHFLPIFQKMYGILQNFQIR